MATTDSPDPAGDATAYRRSLLGRLGDRDPVEVMSATPGEIRRLVAAAGPDLRTRPAAAEWSVLELLGHLVDAELVVGARYRWILAEDRPTIVAYDQDRWAAALHHNEADPDDLIVPFEAMRRANLALWERSSPAERARIGLHAERGPESYEITFRMLAGHDLFHLDQAWRTLDQVRGRAPHAQESR